MINDIIEINTDNLEPVTPESGDVWQRRQSVYSEKRKLSGNIRVSICVQAYNQIEKLRYCLECLQKYTPEDLYELILIDNGSEPEVMDLYKSIEHPRVKIIHITKNISSSFPHQFFVPHINGEYTVWVFADTYVTKNWLENLLTCMDSDKRIGVAAPLSSNTANHQSLDILNGKPMEEIQAFAANFNISDPKKWIQDLRVLTLLPIFRSEIWHTVGLFDMAYYHDFGEDDFCMRIRKAGYKIYICHDTFIYHDHNRKEDNVEKFSSSLSIGHDVFFEKWNIEPWKDSFFNIPFHLQMTDLVKFDDVDLLCIDPKLGKPILNITNHIKRNNGSVKKTCAFTTEAKFYADLTTIADETIVGEVDKLRDYYDDNSFDIICLCAPLNTYPNPNKLLKDLSNLQKEKGILIFHINNSFDIPALIKCLSIVSNNFSVRTGINLTPEDCKNILDENKYVSIQTVAEIGKSSVDLDFLLKPVFQTAFTQIGIPYNDSMISGVKYSKFHFTAVKE